MAKVKKIDCESCGHSISIKAAACPSCGHPNKPNLWSSKVSGKEIFLILLLIAGAIWIMSGVSTGPSGPEQNTLTAWTMCQRYVESRLKSPSTADYPWGYSKYTTALGGGRYRVDSYVDSQNSFGAKIRTKFDCTVKNVGYKKWKLENLVIE